MKYLVLVASLFLHVSIILGQQRLTGFVIDSVSQLKLKNVTIQNHTLNTKTYSDAEGRFSIAAQTGHSISFSMFGYQTQNIKLSTLDHPTIRLSPKVNLLQEVEVRHLRTFPSTWATPVFHGQSMVYKKEYDDPSAGGVVFRVWYWKKDERRRSKQIRKEMMQGAERRIKDLFNVANISLYLPIRGEDLDNFLWHYTPSAELFTDPKFDLLLYLNDSYKKFRELPAASKKIPQLLDR